MGYCEDERQHFPQLHHTLRNLQHLSHARLSSGSLWCHPSQNVDTINENLPSSIETFHVIEECDYMDDFMFIDDDSLAADAIFDAACTETNAHVVVDMSRCRVKDIRRLLLDKKLCSLRQVSFSQKEVFGDFGPGVRRDPHALHRILTAAVRRRGWKKTENISQSRLGSCHEAVLYRDFAHEDSCRLARFLFCHSHDLLPRLQAAYR
jgi:hypothetical protein